MNQKLVLAEWQRAQQALGSAEVLTKEAYYADAVARNYYALFHAAKAAWHVHDGTADTHSGVQRMFGLHLVKPGEIEAQAARPLGRTMEKRLAADYAAELTFSASDAARACREAQGFVRWIRHYLLSKGISSHRRCV